MKKIFLILFAALFISFPLEAAFYCIDEDFSDWSPGSVSTQITANVTANSLQITATSKKEFTDPPGADWSNYDADDQAIGFWAYSTTAGDVTVTIEEEDYVSRIPPEVSTCEIEKWKATNPLKGEKWEFISIPLNNFNLDSGAGDGNLTESLDRDMEVPPEDNHRGVISIEIEHDTGKDVYIDHLILTKYRDDLLVDEFYLDLGRREDIMVRKPPPTISAFFSDVCDLANSTIKIAEINDTDTPTGYSDTKLVNGSSAGTDSSGIQSHILFVTPGQEFEFLLSPKKYVAFVIPRDGSDVGEAKAYYFNFIQETVDSITIIDYFREE